ncbi:MAG: SDR family NAD(P)-dependent oxidoreductase [Bacteroidia bacterium]|nr:SDR family NAD(P)-dependent oxidoreductase [Bacteroidia bacterium]
MKTALITGANRGIGYELAKQLLNKDWRVIVTARDSHKGHEAVSKLDNKNAIFHTLDVASETSIKVVGSFIATKYKTLDLLVNNAGIIATNDDTTSVSMDDVRSVMDCNFFGPVQLSKTVLPALKNSEDGRIINISSGMGAMGEAGRGYAAYRFSKTALNGLTNHMASDLSGTVKVVSVCPGWVKTDMGGSNASRNVTDAVKEIVALAEMPNLRSGKFYRDRKIIDW